MAFNPYLAFSGNCREAFTHYKQIFGGELVLMSLADMPAGAGDPPSGSNPDAVIHGALTSPVGLLMGADDPSGGFDGQVRGMCVSIELSGQDEAERVFNALCAGGQIQLPFGATFFSPGFGMCTDRFGTPWMVMAERPATS